MADFSTKFLHSRFPELWMAMNGGYGGISPLSTLEEIDYPSLLHKEDSIVPETYQNTNLMLSNSDHLRHHYPHDGNIELPSLPDCNAIDYFVGGGSDALLGLDTFEYQKMDVATITHGYTSSLDCSPSAYHVATNLATWQGDQSGQKMNSGNEDGAEEKIITKVGRYSVEERRDKILKYLKKRNQRNFNKTIKTLADRRARVRGRFAKNNEDDQLNQSKRSSLNNNINNYNELMSISPCSYYDDYANYDNQKKEDGREEWLEEAITSLMMYNRAAPYHNLPLLHQNFIRND
ncbi:hypothetical protein V2J09_013590 [Rumex salicifolius]